MTNSNKQFSIGEAFGFGWNTFKANILLLIGVAIVFIIISGIFDFVNLKFFSGKSFLISFLGFLVDILMVLGIIKISLRFHDNKKASVGDLFSCTNIFLPGLIAMVLTVIIVGVGFVLLIIPGIIVGLMLQFCGYFVVDKGLGPIESLKASKKLTHGVKWDLALFALACIGINIAGAICLVIGLLVTIPVTWLANAHVYRKLLSVEEGTKAEEAKETTGEPQENTNNENKL